jgi:myo-inositol-hexaphosphate 3-phosphohydrolase/phosphodiesterase/alkaline phosphatase D-like protein
MVTPTAPATLRFSQFNASLNRNADGDLVRDLSTANNAQARAVAEIIQRSAPDVLLINEFDYVAANPLQPVQLLLQNYLGIGQNGATPITYPYIYIAPSNTGIATGFDLNNNGATVTTPGQPGYGDDAFGFGNFPGQFGMVLLSKYPIDTANIRTFQTFRWKDMPGNLLTNDPTVDNPATPVNENLGGFYSPAEQEVLRLSSKSHWDIPIQVNGQTIHVLASHPTPPVFDGPEDRNGKRNFDEIRFWSDYITPGQGNYIYDDQGQTGGLAAGSRFVIMGDQNADPNDGDSYNFAIRQLLQNPAINTNAIPTSPGGPQQSTLQGGANLTHRSNPIYDTADFADTTPGNLRTDYVLPSADLSITQSRVFWPLNTDPTFAPVGVFNPALPGGFPSSDHRLVWVDVQTGPTPVGRTVPQATLQGQTTFATGFVPPGPAGNVGGNPVPLGGLSGVTYDAANRRYYAISDDRAENGPARFYTFTANLTTNPTVTFTNATTLLDATGTPYTRFSLDPEGIALTHRNTVFVSSEGEVRPDLGATRVTNPFVNEYDLTTGRFVRSLTIPTKFLPAVDDTNRNGQVDAADQQRAGIRNNLAFESLTLSPDQRFLYTATENALFQDGPTASVSTGSRSRIVQFNTATGQAEKEYLYVVDAVAQPPNPSTAFNTNGLVDLLAIDNRGTFLALERSFSTGVPGTGNTIKIYEISLQGATDISVFDSLSSLSATQLAAIQPVQKRLVLNLDSLNLPTGTDNIEGITFGPLLPDGRQSIVLVSDNNFSPTQFTQILALGADLVPTAIPLVETRPDRFDDPALPFSQRADADDPAIYVNPTDAAQSVVITTLKNGGIEVHDLAGNLLQTVNPGNIRYNNVDLIYGFDLNGKRTDLAVASDRNNDRVIFFAINPDSRSQVLTDVTSGTVFNLFQAAPFTPPYSASTRSAYGLATYRSPVSGVSYVFVNRRQTGDVAQYRMFDLPDGTIGLDRVREFTLPTTTGRSPQTEGMVVDQETGTLYIGQEDVGIWKFLAEPDGGTTGTLIDRVKALGGQHLTDDVEGLTIYYGKDGTGYLLASSQGDNTFVVYSRDGSNDYIGRFAVGANGAIDSVQESDGAAVINVPLGPNFPRGLFVTQDGNNDPARIVEGENINSNFKYVPWENIANALPTPLDIDTVSFDPRNPQARPFGNGVASGDTTQTTTVLWTRSTFTGTIYFDVSTSPTFQSIVGTWTATATDANLPVKVQIDQLDPNTTYYYRAIHAQSGSSATGTFSTAAAVGTRAGLRFGASGDWRGEIAPYPAIANADERNLKFFIELGDTVYADVASPALRNPDGTRKNQAETLAEFQTKHNEVYGSRFGENYWADLRRSTSIIATIDDHEVTNDFEGGALASSDPRFKDSTPGRLINDTVLFDNGLQAFQQYNPIRDDFYGQTGDPRTAGERKLYRYATYGSDASVFNLDARSFRDAGLPEVTNTADPVQVGTFLAASFNPNRTMLGRTQVNDLKRDLLDAETKGVTWKFVVVPEPMQNLGVLAASDRFEGYAAERTEILKFVNDNQIQNVVFIAADIHGTLVNNLTYQTAPGQAQIGTSAFEITTGSVGYDAPFGPTVADLAQAVGLLTPAQRAVYDALPTAGKDAFIKQLTDGGLQALGYDPVGLNNNLGVANGRIDATLLQGDYVATHVYGWSEFTIDQATQKLTVTTYGIPPYSEAELLANPAAIINRQPSIASQFEVNPTFNLRGTANADRLTGTAANEIIRGGAGADVLTGGGGKDTFVLEPGAGADTVTDFNLAAGDRLGLGSGLSFGQLAIRQGTGADASNAIISVASGNETLATLLGVQANTLTAAAFVVL